jgi:PleD family two-component response regulator
MNYGSSPARNSHESSRGRFAVMTCDQAAEILGISPSTADRHLSFARAWRVAKNLVAVDDDASMSQAIERILRVGGFTAVTFASPEAVLEADVDRAAACFVYAHRGEPQP